jgi:hypothetical protein
MYPPPQSSLPLCLTCALPSSCLSPCSVLCSGSPLRFPCSSSAPGSHSRPCSCPLLQGSPLQVSTQVPSAPGLPAPGPCLSLSVSSSASSVCPLFQFPTLVSLTQVPLFQVPHSRFCLGSVSRFYSRFCSGSSSCFRFLGSCSTPVLSVPCLFYLLPGFLFQVLFQGSLCSSLCLQGSPAQVLSSSAQGFPPPSRPLFQGSHSGFPVPVPSLCSVLLGSACPTQGSHSRSP